MFDYVMFEQCLQHGVKSQNFCKAVNRGQNMLLDYRLADFFGSFIILAEMNLAI